MNELFKNIGLVAVTSLVVGIIDSIHYRKQNDKQYKEAIKIGYDIGIESANFDDKES